MKDFVYIGSGISSTFTFVKFLKKCTIERIKTNITIIEKSNEFFTGIPYGYRSGKSTLLIKPLSAFLPKDELPPFIDWLKINKGEILKRQDLQKGNFTKKWYLKNKEAIEKGNWIDVYIPRFLVGLYLKNIANKAIEIAERHDLLTLDFVNDEVINIEKKEKSYLIETKKKGDFIKTKNIILAVGASPNRKLFKTDDYNTAHPQNLLIEDPYLPDLETILNKISKYTSSKEKINILIVGTNASGIELNYKLNDTPEIASKINCIYSLSPQGKFPDNTIKLNPYLQFKPLNLKKLSIKNKLTAFEIKEAIDDDLNKANTEEIDIINTIMPISKAFCSLLDKLDKNEKEIFACYVGNAIGKEQREAGEHYSSVVEYNQNLNQLINLRGKLLKIETFEDGALKIFYQTKEGEIIESDKPIHIIINCTGSSDINDNANKNNFLNQLIKKNIFQLNNSKRGIKVTNSLEAAPGFYVNGPLLTGNVIDNKPIWHVEHAGRISTFSEKLSTILFNRITDSKFSVFNIKSY